MKSLRKSVVNCSLKESSENSGGEIISTDEDEKEFVKQLEEKEKIEGAGFVVPDSFVEYDDEYKEEDEELDSEESDEDEPGKYDFKNHRTFKKLLKSGRPFTVKEVIYTVEPVKEEDAQA